MAIDVATGGSVGRQNDEARDGRGLPAKLIAGNHWSQADLDVERPQERIDSWELRLDLDDQQGALTRIPRQNVDRSALTADGVGQLDSDRPAELLKDADHSTNNLGMAFVQEPIQLGAAIPHKQLETSAERVEGAPEVVEREAVEVSGLDLDYLPPANSSRSGYVLLP